MKKLGLILFALFFLHAYGYAQWIAVKTNLLYDATATFNLGFEAALQKHVSVDVSGNFNSWTFPNDKSLKHWMVQPEVRYWLHEAFNGHYLGLHAHYADYDVAGIRLPAGMKPDYCYDGYSYGVGLAYGYQLYLSPRWNVEFTVGGGYTYLEYDKYDFPKEEGWSLGKFRNKYWGLTKAGISIVYLIN